MIHWARAAKILLCCFSLFFAIFTLALVKTALYSQQHSTHIADAAIVLGAAVWGDAPSPVFRERLNHAVILYRKKRVAKIIVTGGIGEGKQVSEAAVGKKYLAGLGIPESAILLEESSHTTWENLAYAKPIAENAGLKSFLIVSDPIHIRRSLLYARTLGLRAEAAPTQTSRYQTIGPKLFFLAAETYYTLRDKGRGIWQQDLSLGAHIR